MACIQARFMTLVPTKTMHRSSDSWYFCLGDEDVMDYRHCLQYC